MPVPCVSVVVAAKNEELHVEDALRSILGQQGVTLELIFVDDSSEDGTPGIVTRLAQEDPRIRVMRNPRRGKVAAFNEGVAAATGRFVCIFAGDDIMPPGSLAARHDAIAGTDDALPVVGVSKLVTMSDVKRFDGHLIPRAPGRGALSGVSPLMNRRSLALIFPVPETLPNEDTWMELAVLHLAGLQVIHSDIICCQWRVHAGNSINMMLPYDRYNERYTARMRALPLFLEQNRSRLDAEGLRVLNARAHCETRRAKGDVLGVATSPVGLVEKLRALSTAHRALYAVRRRVFGLLSGR